MLWYYVALLTVWSVTALTTSHSTQVPRAQAVGSEDVPAKLSDNCIASSEDLYHAFLKRGILPSGRYHFDAHFPNQEHYMRFTTFTVVYNTSHLTEGANGNVSMQAYTLPDVPSDSCCNPSKTGCYAIQTTRQAVYRILPSPLVYMLSLPLLVSFYPTKADRYLPSFVSDAVFIGCWNTPPFCEQHQNRESILNDFTFTLINRHFEDTKGGKSFQETYVEKCIHGLVHRNRFFSFSIYMLSVLISLLTLPSALMVLKSYKPTRNRLTPTLWLATQINSWSLFLLFIANYFISFRQYNAYLAGIPQEVIPCLLPYATAGNYFAIALGCLFALELPFVMWYFAQQELQERAISRRNRCIFRLKTLAHSFGFTGIVLCLQIASGYSVFFLILLLASPLLAMYSLIAQANITVLLTFFTALLLYPCMARNIGRQCFRGCGLLLYISLGTVVSLGFTGILIIATVVDNLTTPLNSNQITTSILSSSLLALMVYIAKKTLWHRLWQPYSAGREDEETPLLLSKDLQDNVDPDQYIFAKMDSRLSAQTA